MDRPNTQLTAGNKLAINLSEDSPMTPSHQVLFINKAPNIQRDPFADILQGRANQQLLNSSNFSGSSKHKSRIPEDS